MRRLPGLATRCHRRQSHRGNGRRQVRHHHLLCLRYSTAVTTKKTPTRASARVGVFPQTHIPTKALAIARPFCERPGYADFAAARVHTSLTRGARRFVQCIRFAKSTSLPWWLAYASAPMLAYARPHPILVSIHYAYL